MTFELIDYEREREISINGLNLSIYPLDEAGRIRLGILSKQYSDAAGRGEYSDELENQFVEALAKQIARVSDPRYGDWSATKVVRALPTLYRTKLLNELFGISSVGEDEKKN